MKIIAAKLETSNFEFVAYSSNTVTASQMLKQAFIDHIEKNLGSLTWLEVQADVYFEEIILNTVVVK
jgi:hypothetical protein